MIEYNKAKYKVRDTLYEQECSRIISSLEEVYISGTYFGIKNTENSISSLRLMITKNNEDRERYYTPNIVLFNKLKDWISWDFLDPLSEFESEVLPLLNEAKELLEKNDYRENSKSSEKLEKIEILLKDYIKKTGFIDSGIRNQIHTRINRLKAASTSGSLFSLMLSEKILNEIKILIDLNSRQYEKSYKRILKKAQVVHAVFEKYKKFIRISETKEIEKQFSEIDEIMKSQSYERFEDAQDVLDVIEIKLDEVRSDKKINIVKNIELDLQKLRSEIWLEDWEQIKSAVEILVAEAEDKGVFDKLNLDKFGIDKKKSEKKKDIFDFISYIRSKSFSNSEALVRSAEKMLKSESYKANLESLTGKNNAVQKAGTEQREGLSPQKKKIIKLTAAGIIIIISFIVFSVNQAKNAEHFSKKGEKYAVFTEALVYTYLKAGREIDREKIRSRLRAPQEDLQIIEISDKEVVIRFKGNIHRKKVRPVK